MRNRVDRVDSVEHEVAESDVLDNRFAPAIIGAGCNVRCISQPVVRILAFVLIVSFEAAPIRAQDGASRGDTLPKDVYPDSRSRLPLIKREALDERGQKAYDTAVTSSGGRPPQGVAAIRLHGTGRNEQFEST